MPIKKLPHIIWKQKNAIIPDPCIKIKKGSGKILGNIIFDPTTAFDVQISSLFGKSSLIKQYKKLKKAKTKKVCLW
jgi:hypothetical protein